MRIEHTVRSLVLGALASVVAPLGCQNKEQPTATAQSSPEPPVPASSTTRATPVSLVRVDAQKVCMVNDHFMNAAQIPVAVEGKTYYGCCPMCERRLREEANSRYGIDPVSKKRVDKAAAVIGKLQSGKVLYFENEQTFRTYQQQT